MKLGWILIAVYALLGILFLALNLDLALGQFQVNLLVAHPLTYLVAGMFLISLLFMVLAGLAFGVEIENCQRERQWLQAQLYEQGIQEIRDLQQHLETWLASMEDRLLRALRNPDDSSPAEGA